MAGQRPSSSAAATGATKLHLGLLGDLQRVIDLNAKIPDGTLELRVPEQELNRTQILGPPVDQRRLGPPQRMGAVSRRVQTNRVLTGLAC